MTTDIDPAPPSAPASAAEDIVQRALRIAIVGVSFACFLMLVVAQVWFRWNAYCNAEPGAFPLLLYFGVNRPLRPLIILSLLAAVILLVSSPASRKRRDLWLALLAAAYVTFALPLPP